MYGGWAPLPESVAAFADRVIAFESGTTATVTFDGQPFNQTESALGAPESFTGENTEFASVVSPFNPPFLTDQIVSIGENGHVTLRLSHYAIPADNGPEIGVFTNAGLVETDFPNGQAAETILPNDGVTSFGMDQAVVEVSENGTHFVTLNGGLPILFDIPTNGFTDTVSPFDTMPGSVKSDPFKPFLGRLSEFNGLNYGQMLSLLDSSAGGTWLDISETGLSRVGFIRFSIGDDGDSDLRLNFELDAVAVAGSATGAIVPEPEGFWLVTLGGAMITVGHSIRRGAGLR